MNQLTNPNFRDTRDDYPVFRSVMMYLQRQTFTSLADGFKVSLVRPRDEPPNSGVKSIVNMSSVTMLSDARGDLAESLGLIGYLGRGLGGLGRAAALAAAAARRRRGAAAAARAAPRAPPPPPPGPRRPSRWR